MYLDVGWTCGGVAHSFDIAVKWLLNSKMLPRLPYVKHSVVPWSVLVMFFFSGNVPLLHIPTQHPGTSLHMISFTRPSPVLVLKVTNARVRRPEYEARVW